MPGSQVYNSPIKYLEARAELLREGPDGYIELGQTVRILLMAREAVGEPRRFFAWHRTQCEWCRNLSERIR